MLRDAAQHFERVDGRRVTVSPRDGDRVVPCRHTPPRCEGEYTHTAPRDSPTGASVLTATSSLTSAGCTHAHTSAGVAAAPARVQLGACLQQLLPSVLIDAQRTPTRTTDRRRGERNLAPSRCGYLSNNHRHTRAHAVRISGRRRVKWHRASRTSRSKTAFFGAGATCAETDPYAPPSWSCVNEHTYT